MRLHIRCGVQFGFVAAMLALLPATASAQRVIDRDRGPGVFSVSLSEARFTGSGGYAVDHGIEVWAVSYELDLSLAPVPGAPFCREVAGTFVVDQTATTPSGHQAGDRHFINLNGTICLDPNTGIITGEGTFETTGMIRIQDGEPVSPLITHGSFPSWTGNFRFVAMLDNSGVAGMIMEFRLIWEA
jgi:hypothetical protein